MAVEQVRSKVVGHTPNIWSVESGAVQHMHPDLLAQLAAIYRRPLESLLAK